MDPEELIRLLSGAAGARQQVGANVGGRVRQVVPKAVTPINTQTNQPQTLKQAKAEDAAKEQAPARAAGSLNTIVDGLFNQLEQEELLSARREARIDQLLNLPPSPARDDELDKRLQAQAFADQDISQISSLITSLGSQVATLETQAKNVEQRKRQQQANAPLTAEEIQLLRQLLSRARNSAASRN